MAGATAREEDAERAKLKELATSSNGSAVSNKSSGSTAAVPNKNTYQCFLDRLRHPSATDVVNSLMDFVADFPSNLPRLQAARRVHEFLLAATPKLLAIALFAEGASEEARRNTEEHFERFVFTKLHKAIYRNLPADVEQDELGNKRLQDRRQASGGRESLDPELSQESQAHFGKAVECLNFVNQYQTPKAKMICILNAYRLVEHVVLCRHQASGDNSEIDIKAKGGDEEGLILRRILEALVIEASPPNFFSSVEFTAAFRQPARTTAEERKCLRDFSAALEAATGLTPKVPWLDLEDLPLWLEGSGVSFRFEAAEAPDLLIGEVHELLGAYHGMASVLQSLAGSPPATK